MCGICGIIDFNDTARHYNIVRMTHSLRHRGPDRQATWSDDHVAFGHARLSILDLSASGDQPMISDDRQHIIVFNGEVYNFRELRQELEVAGFKFFGNSDTEVVLQAFRHWGMSCFQRLNGIFALAIWCLKNQELVLARDRFGVKPLYYHRFAGGLVFGSEIKAILNSKVVHAEVKTDALHEFAFFGAALGQHTLFEGIEKLQPAHWLRYSDGAIEKHEFWKIEDTEPVEDEVEDATSRVRELLERAVRRQLVSDVPVGAFLSGGIDSSAITAFATRHYSGKLNTYSVGFDFLPGPNELARARDTARHFGTEHHELHVSGADLPKTIEALVEHHDEPFGDAADIPLYLLCEQLAGDPKVVLQGDGGDELFAGYRRYALLARTRWWQNAARLATPPVRLLLARTETGRRLNRILQVFAAPDDGARMALLLTTDNGDNSFVNLLSPAWRRRLAETDPFARYRQMNARFATSDPVQRMLYTDTSIILPDIFLEKVDKATMAHGIEARVPFLDNELTSYALGLPSSMKVRGKQKKFLLRRALRGIVPDSTLDAPKVGFSVPYGCWLRVPLAAYVREVLGSAGAAKDSFFDNRVVLRCLDDHQAGRRQHGFILWKALQLALWQQRYLSC